MTTYVFWFLMLVPPKPGQPVFVQRFGSAVDCQVQVVNLREKEPTKLYECKKVTSHIDLSKSALD